MKSYLRRESTGYHGSPFALPCGEYNKKKIYDSKSSPYIGLLTLNLLV